MDPKKEIELKQKESKLSKRLSDKQILLIGAKFALIQKAKGKTVEEILNQENFADSVKAADIAFLEEDLELSNLDNICKYLFDFLSKLNNSE